MRAKRPAWFPDRLDWYPGDPYRYLSYSIREAGAPDYESIQGILRAAGRTSNPRVISKWLSQNCYSVRLAVRNSRHVVGMCVSRHLACESSIQFLFVYPPYRSSGVEGRLVLLAACEVPESALYWSFRAAEDETRGDRLVETGWLFDASTVKKGNEWHSYSLAPFVGRGVEPDGEGCDPPFINPANGEPDRR